MHMKKKLTMHYIMNLQVLCVVVTQLPHICVSGMWEQLAFLLDSKLIGNQLTGSYVSGSNGNKGKKNMQPDKGFTIILHAVFKVESLKKVLPC